MAAAVKEKLAAAWERAFFAPAPPSVLSWARAVVSLHALWILLSRTELPSLASWPGLFWDRVDPGLAARFGAGLLPESAEQALFVALLLALLAAALGFRPRVSCAAAGLLLYHFAPQEEILAGIPHTSFGGLTVPTLALLVLAFAETPRRGHAPSAEFRWPLTLIRLVFSLAYLFPALAKLRYSGPGWFTAENVAGWLWVNHALTGAPWAPWLAVRPAACWAIALGTLALELLFPLAVFSRRAAFVLVPAAALFHLGTVFALGYFFPSLPLLLLFVERPSRQASTDSAPAPLKSSESAAASMAAGSSASRKDSARWTMTRATTKLRAITRAASRTNAPARNRIPAVN